MLISHLVAASENNVIGTNNELPWSLPNDFKYFKNKTWGMPVIMGRKTYASLVGSLPGRFNIVVTRQHGFTAGGAIVANSIETAVEKAKETDAKEVFIIGGGKIFEQSMEMVQRIYITRVHANVEGDTFYPAIDETKWRRSFQDKHPADEKHRYAYTFETWDKINLENASTLPSATSPK